MDSALRCRCARLGGLTCERHSSGSRVQLKMPSRRQVKCDDYVTNGRTTTTTSNRNKCDHQKRESISQTKCQLSSLLLPLVTLVALIFTQQAIGTESALIAGSYHNSSSGQTPIIVDHHHIGHHNHLSSGEHRHHQTHDATTAAAAAAAATTTTTLAALHLQPSYAYGARNKSINFTHLAVDELTGSIYVGATNWLFQLSATNLRPEVALKTGPASENSPRDCAPADCLSQIAHIDANSLPMGHLVHTIEYPSRGGQNPSGNHLLRSSMARPTMHMSAGFNATTSSAAQFLSPLHQTGGNHKQPARPLSGGQIASAAGSQVHNNNYNKILALDLESRQLIVCGSLNQGACRRHQLGQLANYSELIPLPVVSNDEHSSSVALVVGGGGQKRAPILYVAATNSRLGPYREMVPAISARHLEQSSSRAMQIIERSFTDSARVDISFELRDYYLVNYVHSFQHGDYIYFATVQRKSPLRQLEEWGYTSRLARLCLSDLSFQSYTELSLECRQPWEPAGSQLKQQQQHQQQPANQGINYNLMQDAYLTAASSHLASQLGVRAGSQVLIGAFAQSRDHTTKTQQKSALCLFPMDRVEQKFNENIHLCYNGSLKARNMNYIAGSVNDCPKAGKSGNIANFCNEPIKLNGSLPLVANPVITYDSELITSVAATQAPTSPVNLNSANGGQQNHQQDQQRGGRAAPSQRQHQVLVAGTGSGSLKKIALVSGEHGFGLRGVEFDQVQIDDQQEPILADLHLMPSAPSQQHQDQFAIAATPYKVAKLRVNSCKVSASHSRKSAGNSSMDRECHLCSQLQDPFCGWCTTSGSCSSRDECLASGAGSGAANVHWSPFDQIKCSDYQPIVPKFVPLQSTASGQQVEVNIRLASASQQLAQQSNGQWAAQLAQAQFVCHFDYLSLANRSAPMPRLTGATTKAMQARLNSHTSTVVIGCPLPAPAQRPVDLTTGDFTRAKLTVRLANSNQAISEIDLQQLLGLRATGGDGGGASQSGAPASGQQSGGGDIEREISFYDCTLHTDCRSCLTAGPSRATSWSCSWCPLSNRCTFNASHPEFGCAASAVSSISTTPNSLPNPNSNSVRASHLTSSLDQAQASMFGLSIDRLAQCPGSSDGLSDELASLASVQQQQQQHHQPQASNENSVKLGPEGQLTRKLAPPTSGGQAEILVPHNSRRSIQVPLRQPIQSTSKRVRLECLVEIEGSKAKLSGQLKLVNEQQVVVCQENLFTYQEEIATQRGQLTVILSEINANGQQQAQQMQAQQQQQQHQVIEMTDVILYKCHLFGVNPPALTSTIGAPMGQHSSAAWRAHDFLSLVAAAAAAANRPGKLQANPLIQRRQIGGNQPPSGSTGQPTGDCSLCTNVERKYQCAWCANSCLHVDQCGELPASTCPPPRIYSVHPTSGPLEGGTLLTIEGSNLGSNEREIQDKISVGGEPCQLVMYSVSTRIVCKTGPSLHGPQAATVFVGNRAGVTSAYEKFHYKAVHLTDVKPRVGPVSGGTRLFLSGSNLNVGSRVQIFLDDIPCALDRDFEAPGNQITCVTAPNLMANSMRITKLTLMIDNSTHHLPYPFTYQPDPIITSIEPAESFISGGRLILISGHHLAAPQSVKLMVYHEHKRSIVNGTSCSTMNDTLITCLTPAISREMLASLPSLSSDEQRDQQVDSGPKDGPWTSSEQSAGATSAEATSEQLHSQGLSYESGGVKLKIVLFMDDVKSVRNLDEYYHHLPHYITYYEDPQLFRLPKPIVDFSDELTIQGDHLKMRQLDQDTLITIGASSFCPIKSISPTAIVCEPPKTVAPVYEENGRLIERPLLPIIALIGSNLKFELGHMQYSAHQYQLPAPGDASGGGGGLLSSNQVAYGSALDSNSQQSSLFGSSSLGGHGGGGISPSGFVLIALSAIGFIVGLVASLLFALNRFRQSKAEREYKRIQLQMGSLDVNGQPTLGSSLFDKIHFGSGATGIGGVGQFSAQNQRHLVGDDGFRARALEYFTATGSGKGQQFVGQRPYQIQHTAGNSSFPPSPQTDISTLNRTMNNHLVRLTNQQGQHIYHQVAQSQHYGVGLLGGSQTSQSSPSSSSGSNHNNNNQQQQHHQQQQQQPVYETAQGQSDVSSSSPVSGQGQASNNNSNSASQLRRANPANNSARNFSWTQAAPSTVVPYSLIEACNLTLEGKQAIREFV